MVLQNKYKARASRRYNAARGGASDARGRGRAGRRGGGPTRQQMTDETSFPSLRGQEDEDEEEEESDSGNGDEGDEKASAERERYAPRQLSSNAWRFQQDETQGEENGERSESDSEVDLSAVLKHVANLDSSRASQAISTEQEAETKLNADAADVDVSLLPMMQKRQQLREEQAQARSGDSTRDGQKFLDDSNRRAPQRHALSEKQRRELEEEGRRLQIEKERQEKHDRKARILQQQAKIFSLDASGSLSKGQSSHLPALHDGTKDQSAFLYNSGDGGVESKNDRKPDTEDLFARIEDKDDEDNHDGQTISGKAKYPVQAPSRASRARGMHQAPPPVVNGSAKEQNDEEFLDDVLG